jgi:uncharacterized protein
VPERQCLGCGRRAPQAELVRFAAVKVDERTVLVRDDGPHRRGRGLYVCPDPDCFARAEKRRSFARGARLAGAVLDVDSALAPQREGRE